MADFVALFRGINVGRAKRIGMADLRQVFLDLGFANVRTLLNSGNVLFSSPRTSLNKFSREIEDAVQRVFGISATVVVITAAQLRRVVEGNPLLNVVKDPARHLVAFSASPVALEPVRALLKQPWHPDALALTTDAVYLWCVAGVLDSPLSKAFARAGRDVVTARNWSTILKLHLAARCP